MSWNMHSIFLKRAGVLLTLSPESARFSAPVSEGSVLQAAFLLENKTPSNLTIVKLSSSCGCTKLVSKEGDPIPTPMMLTPAETFSFVVHVDTKDMEGQNAVSVMAMYKQKDQSLFTTGSVLFEVMPHGEKR